MSMTTPEKATWTVVALAVAGVVALGVVAGRAKKKPRADVAVGTTSSAAELETAGVGEEKRSELLFQPIGELGDHVCVERSGRAMNTSELRGKFVVADFIFTNCGGTCPRLSERMAELQIALKGVKSDDVQLVSFSVDPERDTPQALTEYAKLQGADEKKWLFLRCDKKDVADIAFDRMKLWTSKDELIGHSNKFALLDRTGAVRAFYSPLEDRRWIEKLLSDLKILRQEPAK